MKAKSTTRTEQLMTRFDRELHTILKHELLLQKVKKASTKLARKVAA